MCQLHYLQAGAELAAVTHTPFWHHVTNRVTPPPRKESTAAVAQLLSQCLDRLLMC